MVVCKFYQEGRCRYGDGCRNEHPGRNSFQQPQSNRFAPLSNQGGSGGFGSRGRSGNADENPYHLVTDDIRNDVTYVRDKKEGERPAYPFGAYGPGRGAPKQLIEGPLELSPEELRVQAYLAQATGTLPQFEAQYTQLEQLMNSKVQNILANTEDAKRYAADESQPNRNDNVIKPAPGTWPFRIGQHTSAPSGGFGTSSNTPSGGFGAASQPSGGFGALSRPKFGASSQPTFGAPSAPGGGGFGAPSALGAKPAPFGASTSTAPPSTGFGAPSALGAKPNPFGAQPSAGGFGAPSALGAKANPFGGAQQPATGAFGAPSALGQKPNPFGGAQQPATGGFGAPSQPAFGSSGFGATAARPAASPFAPVNVQPTNPSPFGSTAQPTGGFGGQPATVQTNNNPFGSQQPATQTSNTPFGSTQPAQTSGIGFGAPSAFGANRPSPFATSSTQQQSGLARPNPFAAKSPAPAEPPGTATFGANNLAPGTQTQNLPATWKAHRVVRDPKNNTPGYPVVDKSKPDGRGVERIWFPYGPPEISEKLNAMTQAPAPVYEDPSIGPKLKEVYEWVSQSGTFAKDGAIIMPEIPPKRVWCAFEL